MLEITNNGGTIKINNNGSIRLIVKSQIRFIDIVKGTTIKLDTGQGINNVYIIYANVTLPVLGSVDLLRDAINDMLSAASMAGGATETKQDSAITQLTSIKTDLDNLFTKISAINDKAFYDPLLVDEGTPSTVYKGYAAIGSLVTDAVWAISKVTVAGDVTTTKWASGNKNMDKIWNNREALIYS